MYNNRRHNKLFAGLVDKGVEFFVHKNEVYCIHDGATYTFDNFPQWIIDLVEMDMLKHREALKALAAWENLTQDDYIRQYIYCRFGGLDAEPDISADREISYSEYFDCGLRGQCAYEGKLCCSLKVANGNLTRQEIEVLRRIQLQNKNIADDMCISVETVNSHIQNIIRKTDLSSKVELAVFAAKKGII